MPSQAFQIIVILILLACSAFFSGSETAFSNLSRRQIKQLRESKHRLSHLAAKLINKQRQLLNCFLFGNMTVNVLFYATVSVLIVRINQQSAIASAIVAFFS